MKRKAAIGNHPSHSMLVPLPIGAFSLVLAGDAAHFYSADPFWYRFSTAAVALYAVSDLLRQSGAGLRTPRWWTAVAFSSAGYLLLASRGWLGGTLANEKRVGVVPSLLKARNHRA